MKKENIIATKYWHIDNGGFTIDVDKFGNMELSFGFHGYSNTKITMSHHKGFGPKEVSDFLAKAAFEIEKSNENKQDLQDASLNYNY